MGRIIILLALCFCLTGCGTVAYLVNPPPKAGDLYVTEDDVLAVIESLDEEQSNPDAVVYNPNTDRYEITPEAMERAVSDSVMKKAYEANIEEAVEKMDGWNLGAVFRRDVLNILTGALGVLLIIFLL